MPAGPGAPGTPRDPRASAIAIVRRLRERGHTALLAGGCVRDELLGQHPEDYDVATDATPDRVAELFSRTRAVGKAFGVMLVTHAGFTVEVATFRAEGAYSDKRRPDAVRFSTPEDDARRRDFTINALFIDPLDESERAGGRIIDFVGGMSDLLHRTIRAVGDPETRLAEDHLRALRAVRFAARLGFDIDPATAAAISRHATELAGVSRERIGEELRRMLSHRNRGEAASVMHRLGLDGPALTEPCQPSTRPVLVAALPPDADFTTALAAWALDRADAPCPLEPAAAEELASSVGSRWRSALCLTNEERERFTALVRTIAFVENGWETAPVSARKRAAARPWFREATRIVGARLATLAHAIEQDVHELERAPGGLAPEPIVTGDHLAAAGFAPGPRFGRWLDRLYDLQLEGELRDPAAGIALVRQWDAAERRTG